MSTHTENEIVQEVWSVATNDGHLEISVEAGPPVPLSEDQVILVAENSDFNRARTRLAIRAPTFYRLLEQVLKIDTLPDDMRNVILTNLHRATPTRYAAPTTQPRRATAWDKLLDDDSV